MPLGCPERAQQRCGGKAGGWGGFGPLSGGGASLPRWHWDDLTAGQTWRKSASEGATERQRRKQLAVSRAGQRAVQAERAAGDGYTWMVDQNTGPQAPRWSLSL